MALIPIHPGEHLAEELEELGMSATELARKLDVPPNRITAILKGQRAITADTALRLAHFFGTSAEFWLNLQNMYELRSARKSSQPAIEGLPTCTVAGSHSATRSNASRSDHLQRNLNELRKQLRKIPAECRRRECRVRLAA